MSKNFVFDVDGTLTHARKEMTPEFKTWFLNWMKNKNVYLVTGSDRPKTIEQVGEDVVNALTRDYSGLMKAMNKKKDGHYRP